MSVSLAIFFLGIKRYRKQGPLGSPLTTLAQVLVAVARKWRVNEMHDGYGVYRGDERDGSNRTGQSKARTMARTNQLRYVSILCVHSYCFTVQRKKKPDRVNSSLNLLFELLEICKIIIKFTFGHVSLILAFSYLLFKLLPRE